MKITDTVTLGDGRVNASGYFEANARTARAGVQQYLGRELGRPELNIVNVYRDEAEVFAKASLDTFSRVPITNDHPPEAVTAKTWRKYAVGSAGDEVLRDGEYLKIGLKVTDEAAVQAIMDGKRELSVGYDTTIVWDAGIAPDGTPFQARQTAIMADHIAIVDRGRAGSEVRIGDGAASWGASPIHVADRKEPDMPDINLRTVVVDALSVQTTDQGAQAIDKLLGERDAARQATTDAATTHAKALADKDAELAKKDAEIDDLKAKQLSDADLDKRVAERADLLALAGAIAKDVKTAGLSDADIRKAVVVAKLGDAAIKDKAPAYIDARFDILAEGVKDQKAPDPVRDALGGGLKAPVTTETAYGAMQDRMTTAWQNQPAKGAA